LSKLQVIISPHLLSPPHLPQSICHDSMPDAQSRSRRRQSTLTKQACDACKLRKVKCIYDHSVASTGLGHQPCQRCRRMTLDCTFSLPQKCRGPRRPMPYTRCVLRSYRNLQDVLTVGLAAAMTLIPLLRTGRQQHKMPLSSRVPDLVIP
jgi:hypothetical protein